MSKEPSRAGGQEQEVQQGASTQSTSLSVGAPAASVGSGGLRGGRSSGLVGDAPLLSVMGFKACESRGI